jgi:hypothetical protein
LAGKRCDSGRFKTVTEVETILTYSKLQNSNF